jgi:ascorbate PTS system EIIC component
MEIIFFIIELLQLPAIILGLIALAGLLLQRKRRTEVINGTIKTVLGLLIMGVGIGAIITALLPIQDMFETGIPAGGGLQTFVTFDEAVVAAIQDANIAGVGGAIAYTLLFGFIIHLILARITPFKYVYLTGHMIWIHAGAFAILFHSFAIPDVAAIAMASLVTGVYFTVMPALAQPVMRKITGSDDIAFGHGQTLLNMTGAWVGTLVGNPEDSTEKLEVKEGWGFFRDIAVSTSIVMIVVVAVGAVLSVIQIGIGGFQEAISGGQNWLVFALLQALGFTAGMLVLLQGVRMLIAEIVPAFQGIAEKVIPGARPALDVPVIFPFAPNALLIGLIVGTIAQVFGMVALGLIGWPVPLPSMIVAFFASGAGAIFGNATGGKRGAIAAAFIWGFVGWFMISFAYKFQVFGDLAGMGAEGLAFTVPDAIIPGILIWLLARLFGIA